MWVVKFIKEEWPIYTVTVITWLKTTLHKQVLEYKAI